MKSTWKGDDEENPGVTSGCRAGFNPGDARHQFGSSKLGGARVGAGEFKERDAVAFFVRAT
jgi:hypothetical protein